MIRELRFEDVPVLLAFLRSKEQRELMGVTEAEAMNADMHYWNNIMRQLLDSNCSFISVNSKGAVDGIALGMIIPYVWSPNRKELMLLAVKGYNRITTAKLFKTWNDKAACMPGVNRVLVDSIKETNFKYENIGYKKLRETYFKEV